MNYKELLFGQEARNKILKGVQIVDDAVGSTLGPRGTNCIFEESSFPTITKDGVSVARQIFLKDKFENMGAMMVREAAENTNREA
ncbi:MAG: chaperonin GroEL, partial [Candidatus Subteraquimicrobiales bacterium]|nr:chaperonin GroEL [Candidatus Subteraquimicrobiales bacterium]